jgi:hypothetical protein
MDARRRVAAVKVEVKATIVGNLDEATSVAWNG